MKRHDVQEPGQLQMIALVWPPPVSSLRLGISMSFYAPNLELWRRMALSMVARRSTSPDMDLRQSPRQSLGSGPNSRQWNILGGPLLEKKAAEETESKSDEKDSED